jgi:hypothetical protein
MGAVALARAVAGPQSVQSLLVQAYRLSEAMI